MAVLAIGVGGVHAQDVAQDPRVVSEALRFEVASVKPSADSQPMSRLGNRSPGRFQVTGFPLVSLLAMAYGTAPARIIVPEWALRSRFDIEARMPADTSRPQVREMLRSLLEDRFSVKATRQVRSMSVMALLRVRDDGRLGPQLQRVQRDCSEVSREVFSLCQWSEAPGLRIARGSTWEDVHLADFLETYLSVIVVDRTELSGQFDLRLEWRELPDGQDHRPVSVEIALREQLGLKLERVREDVELLVIEQISMPSPN